MNYRKLFVIGLGIVGGAAFFYSFAFSQHLLSISPTSPRGAAGKVYELSNHGYLFYVTRQQYWLLHTLVYGGWTMGVIAALLNYRWKVVKNLTRDGWRLPT